MQKSKVIAAINWAANDNEESMDFASSEESTEIIQDAIDAGFLNEFYEGEEGPIVELTNAGIAVAKAYL